MVTLLILALFGALSPPAFAQGPSTHPCDVLDQRVANVVDGKPFPLYWNPLVGAPVTLLFCGPRDEEYVSYTWTLDGVAQPNPGTLALAHYEGLKAAYPEYQTAGRNGLVPYVSSTEIVVLPTVGPHVIRVTYGAGNVVTFTWLGAEGVCERDEAGKPRPSNWIGLGELRLQVHATCTP